MSDNGNFILDWTFDKVGDWSKINNQLIHIPGRFSTLNFTVISLLEVCVLRGKGQGLGDIARAFDNFKMNEFTFRGSNSAIFICISLFLHCMRIISVHLQFTTLAQKCLI